MSDKGKAILTWWRTALDRDSSAGRALAARLRRASPVEVLCEAQVHELALRLGVTDADRLVRLATLLAEVRTHEPQTLAKHLGGAEPVLSQLRFQRLMRATGDDLTNSLRRAIRMAGHRCNVAALGEDVLFWSDRTRMTWCFHYFGADAPHPMSEETSE